MIIVKIIGGLGNQLFQYAAARRLSLLHRTSLKLDISGFGHYTWHTYSLAPFHIQEAFATPEEVQRLKPSTQGLSRILFSWNHKLNPFCRPTIFAEADVRPYDSRITKMPPDLYLDGYWQTEKYFSEIQEVIRNEFTVKYPQDATSREMANVIRSVKSVNLHVRRGNYVSIPEVNAVHGTCSIDYYRKAVAVIAERVRSPHFFVFSDDSPWARENLHFDYPATFVNHNDASRDYEDLRLMTMCKYHIIANSTFSWWGAWLCANPDKVVIAPQRWFNNPNIDTSNLLPDEWIRI